MMSAVEHTHCFVGTRTFALGNLLLLTFGKLALLGNPFAVLDVPVSESVDCGPSSRPSVDKVPTVERAILQLPVPRDKGALGPFTDEMAVALLDEICALPVFLPLKPLPFVPVSIRVLIRTSARLEPRYERACQQSQFMRCE